jgi:hypothetical protein
MPASVLSPGTTAASSSDIVVTTPNKTVALYRSLDDGLLLEGGVTDELLIQDGTSLLLEQQAGDAVSLYDEFPIYIKDPLGGYNPAGISLRSYEPFKELGPGTWQVRRLGTTAEVGVQVD